VAKIKRLLQVYALARPSIRLSMKVIKAKSEKGNFLYVPITASATIREVVSRVIGKDCAAQCKFFIQESHGFQLQAFLPIATSEAAKINKTGPFLYLDSRPVTNARGVFRQIVKLYQKNLRASSRLLEAVKDPFLYLDITCPKGSYDLIVEPAKDDVIFDDGSQLISAVEELLTVVFPEQGKTLSEDVVLNPLMPIPSSPVEEQKAAALPLDANMFGLEDGDMLLVSENDPMSSTNVSEPASAIGNGVELSNPWIIARMNAPVHSIPFQGSSIIGAKSPRSSVPRSQAEDFDQDFLEPERLETEPFLPIRHAKQAVPMNQFTPINRLGFTPINSSDLSQYGLPTPVPSSSPIRGTPLSSIFKTPRRRKRLGAQPNAIVNTSIAPPGNDSNWFDFGRSRGSARRPRLQVSEIRTERDIREVFRNSGRTKATLQPLVTQGNPSDFIGAPVTTPINPIVPGNEIHDKLSTSTVATVPERYISLIESSTPHEIPPRSKRRRTTESRRTKSSRLPLERVPAVSRLHNLTLSVPITLRSVCNGMSKLDKDANFIDWYDAAHGLTTFSMTPSAAEMQEWSKRIVRFLSNFSEFDGEVDQEEVEYRVVAAVERAERS
jgi:hypothetical protein